MVKSNLMVLINGWKKVRYRVSLPVMNALFYYYDYSFISLILQTKK